MSLVRVSYRTLLLTLVIISGTIVALMIQRGAIPRSGFASITTRWWHKRVTRALGIKLRILGTPVSSAALFVANHMSWLDIHLLGSHLPVRFVSKAEVKKWPFLGWLASRAGTLYMPRGSKHASAQVNRNMQQALLNDQHVVLFPEATTSNGEVKRFHSRLMQSAIDAQCLMQPVAIRYPDTSGNNVHEAVLYTGDTTFMQSAINIITAKNIIAELHFLDPIDTQNKTRDELARYAEKQVKTILNVEEKTAITNTKRATSTANDLKSQIL